MMHNRFVVPVAMALLVALAVPFVALIVPPKPTTRVQGERAGKAWFVGIDAGPPTEALTRPCTAAETLPSSGEVHDPAWRATELAFVEGRRGGRVRDRKVRDNELVAPGNAAMASAVAVDPDVYPPQVRLRLFADGRAAKTVRGEEWMLDEYVFDPLPWAWNAAGTELRLARQAKNARGFAVGPVRPVAVSLAGIERSLPAPRDSAGRLDRLDWVGTSDIAVAGFALDDDARGAAREPMLAFVDTARGLVLDRIALRALEGQRGGEPPYYDVRLTPRLLPPGGAPMLVRLSNENWVVWQAGAPPLTVRHGYRLDRPTVLTPDGRSLVIITAARLTYPPQPTVPSPNPPKLVFDPRVKTFVGPILVRHALRTGAVEWRLCSKIADAALPTFSDDGRYMATVITHDGHRDALIVESGTGRAVSRWRIFDYDICCFMTGPLRFVGGRSNVLQYSDERWERVRPFSQAATGATPP